MALIRVGGNAADLKALLPEAGDYTVINIQDINGTPISGNNNPTTLSVADANHVYLWNISGANSLVSTSTSTVQMSKDGINFEIKTISTTPIDISEYIIFFCAMGAATVTIS